jgi:hypothetical protein
MRRLACSFIALAAWVRQLPFRLLKSRVVMECLQSRSAAVLQLSLHAFPVDACCPQKVHNGTLTRRCGYLL